MKKSFKEFLASKSIENFETMNAEEQAKLYNEYNTELKNYIETLEKNVDGKATKEDLQKAIQDFNETRLEQTKSIFKALEEQGLSIKALLEKSQKVGEPQETLKGQIVTNKTDLQDVAKGVSSKEIVMKANTTRSSIIGNQQAHELNDIGQLAYRKLSAYDLFPRVQISESNNNGVVRYYDWDEATITRAAAMIAEGGAFPESTASFKTYTIPLQKVGDTLPVSEEFFEDEAMFASELEMFLKINVEIVIDNQIINGDGTGDNLTGLTASSTPFVAVASGITDASIYDLAVKVSESITANAGNKYSPNFGMMNIIDINRMKLKKDANNNYIMPPFVSRDGAMVSSMVVVEDNGMVANTMVVGDSRYAKIYEKTGLVVSRGLIKDQFTSDMMTLKVRKRLAFLIRKADAGGFMYVSDIDADLVTLAS